MCRRTFRHVAIGCTIGVFAAAIAALIVDLAQSMGF